MPLKFKKTLISKETYETAAAFDVDGDGIPDIVSGGWWYKGPDFEERHKVCEVRSEGEYYDDFSTIPMDINGNGRMDFVTGGWFGCNLRWHENPGNLNREWSGHIIAECGNVETTRAWDVDGDGQLEIVPNTPPTPLVVYKLIQDENGKGTGEFTAHKIYDKRQGHGLGFGDITGNGRGDFILQNGWLEAPDDTYGGEWTFHPDFDLGSASVPILVVDVNHDGLNDLIVGQAHPYGLDWWEQGVSESGERTWVKHPIDPYNSQYHDIQWVDIDGDGECELVTGKRYRAHCGGDPGADDDIGLYYFKWNGESFTKQVIDYGPAGIASGCGIFFHVIDLNGNGMLDIVAPGKEGLFIFENLGQS
ncbi:MAG: VCBS repeat-containing protein [Candidatus Poribacteria bacterium]|nr:VCBS repeat-containing protein [Candidatus Poribacteria bacterium]